MAKKSNNKRAAKQAYRTAERAAKKHPKAFWATVAILLVIVLIVGAIGYWAYATGRLDKWLGRDNGGDSVQIPGQVGTIETDKLSVHFLELGNKYAGDCTLIKVGNTEVLIDAGSRQGSAATIVPYIKQFCTDGVLEYVIATHAHQDHIAAFVGTKSAPGVFDSFECETIIDFPITDSDTEIVKSYYAKRDAEVAAGAAHYTALQCWNNADGAQRSYALSENVTMNILYQKFYEEHTSDENDYSVCMLLTQGEYHYLFTGDLEKDGEASLVKNNDLPHCKLFKGGHHGSKTSSTSELLRRITPEVVCVCCCAGSPEYTKNIDNIFPTQDFIDRVGEYTKYIYVTSLATDIDIENKKWEFTSMNGNIRVTSNGIAFDVACSNNVTLLKDTDWFKENRVWNGVA